MSVGRRRLLQHCRYKVPRFEYPQVPFDEFWLTYFYWHKPDTKMGSKFKK